MSRIIEILIKVLRQAFITDSAVAKISLKYSHKNFIGTMVDINKLNYLISANHQRKPFGEPDIIL